MLNNQELEEIKNQIIPGKQKSLWIGTTPQTNYPKLKDYTKVDVVIIGAGIVGLTAAYLLKKAGKTVAVIEASKIAKGVTGHTTAKLTSLHGIYYERLIKKFGEKKARLYAEANEKAKEKVAEIVNENAIDCNFMREAAFNYTEVESGLKELKREAEALGKASLDASFTTETALPFEVKGAIKLDNQARFHVRKYLLSIAALIPGEGSHIFEKTRALDVKHSKPCIVATDKGRIRGDQVILATHFPFYDKRLLFTRLYPKMSYITALSINGEVPDGMYYSSDDNHHTFRKEVVEDKTFLIIGGGDHPTGRGGDTMKYYLDIIEYAAKRFDIKSVDYYWSAMDYQSSSGLPLIGRRPMSHNIFLATGFHKWGMTNGTLAAMIITDLITGKENPYERLFSPSHINLVASGSTLIKEGFGTGSQYVKSYLKKRPHRSPNDLKPDEWKIIKTDHKKTAAHKEEDGSIEAVSAVCKHLFCIVNWNNAEKTWDCPCHGSRYDREGKVIHGPTVKDLEKR